MIEFLPLVLTGLSITASIIYYSNTLANATKTRQTQLFMSLYDKYQSTEFRRLLFSVLEMDLTQLETEMKKQDTPGFRSYVGITTDDLKEIFIKIALQFTWSMIF